MSLNDLVSTKHIPKYYGVCLGENLQTGKVQQFLKLNNRIVNTDGCK